LPFVLAQAPTPTPAPALCFEDWIAACAYSAALGPPLASVVKYLRFRGSVAEGAVFFSDRGLFVFSWGAADTHLLVN